MIHLRGEEHCFGKGGHPDLTNPMQTANTGECYHGDTRRVPNVRREEGNNPDRQLKVPKFMVKVGNDVGKAQTARMWLRSSHHLKKA